MIQSVLINAPRLLEEMYHFPATIYSPMSSVSEVNLKVVIMGQISRMKKVTNKTNENKSITLL